jgi:hypothetical protein
VSTSSGLVNQLSRERDHLQRKLSGLNAAPGSFCRCVSEWHPDYAEETVSQRSGANCGGAEGPMEKAGVQTPNR